MSINSEDIYPLVSRYYQRLRDTPLDFKRYLYNRINWNARIVGIKGSRGVGKTTLLLQHILDNHKNPDEVMYASLDDMWFANHSLEDLVEYLYSRGVRELYLDEVHTYQNWSRFLKNFYDVYKDLKIYYTGSALLEIEKSGVDLSRRQTLYTLNGMSFREFLLFNQMGDFPAKTLEDLLSTHVNLSLDISSKIPVLKYFDEYLHHGYYPFYNSNPEDFEEYLSSIVKLVIEVDIPKAEEISQLTIMKLKQLMMVLADNPPLEPNISKLSEKLECSRDLCIKMINLLHSARLTQNLFKKINSYKQMRGPEKILGGDPNILYALNMQTNIGTLRESFFANQISCVSTKITLAAKGDFEVNEKYTFEVGGSNKKFSQIADIPNSYLVVDNITSGYESRIPLWLFGFLY